MARKKYTKRQIAAFFEESQGKCWRCGQPIVHQVYGVGWILGHCDKPHWMGGVKVAPEHTSCNMEDAKQQTKDAAKSVRIRARNAGIKKPSSFRPTPTVRIRAGHWENYICEVTGRERSRWVGPEIIEKDD